MFATDHMGQEIVPIDNRNLFLLELLCYLEPMKRGLAFLKPSDGPRSFTILWFPSESWGGGALIYQTCHYRGWAKVG